MTLCRSAFATLTWVGLIAFCPAVVAHADEAKAAETTIEGAAKPQPKPKPKHPPKIEKESASPTAAYDAPLQLDFDPMKRVILKAEPSVPYQPQAASRAPQTQTADDAGKAHLAPMLREASTPDSFGDKGSFVDRHEFGIQLKDHF